MVEASDSGDLLVENGESRLSDVSCAGQLRVCEVLEAVADPGAERVRLCERGLVRFGAGEHVFRGRPVAPSRRPA